VFDKVEEIGSDEINEASVDIDDDNAASDETNGVVTDEFGKRSAIVAAGNKHASKKAFNIAQEISGMASEQGAYNQYIYPILDPMTRMCDACRSTSEGLEGGKLGLLIAAWRSSGHSMRASAT
jgi:hypothetical protein